MAQQIENLQRFMRARLSAEGAFGLHLTVGVALMLAAAWAFAGIADEVMEGAPITALDARLAQWLHQHASHGFTIIMLGITWLHSVAGIALLALLFGAWLYRRRLSYWLLALVLTVPGGMLLNVAFKQLFQRARPHFDDPMLTLATYSFPSGHTASATVLYGLLACYLAAHADSRGRRVLAVAGALAAVALVALSRMYLGVHYLSDVLAAAAEGSAWLAICVTAVSTLRRHRAQRGAA
jgi:undecaprenyl-diphosphatase